MAEGIITLDKIFQTESLQSKTVQLDSLSRFCIIFGGAGKQPVYTNPVYGFVVIVYGSRYGVIYKGSDITIEELTSPSAVKISSSISMAMTTISI